MHKISRILGWRLKKKVFIMKCANFGVKTKQKKKDFHRKICKKMVLAQEYWIDDQYFGGVRPRTAVHSNDTEPVTFFGTQSSLGGHISRLGRHKQWFGWHRPKMPSLWRRAWCRGKAARICWLVTFCYHRTELTNCKNQFNFKVQRYGTP